MDLNSLPKAPQPGRGRAGTKWSHQDGGGTAGARGSFLLGIPLTWPKQRLVTRCGVSLCPEREWADQSSRLASGKAVCLITISPPPGWPCSMGTATWWITCPSPSSTTFSRASCTSTPRASGCTALCSTLPLSSANTLAPPVSVSPLCLSCLSVSPSPHLDCSPPPPPTVWGPAEHHGVPYSAVIFGQTFL